MLAIHISICKKKAQQSQHIPSKEICWSFPFSAGTDCLAPILMVYVLIYLFLPLFSFHSNRTSINQSYRSRHVSIVSTSSFSSFPFRPIYKYITPDWRRRKKQGSKEVVIISTKTLPLERRKNPKLSTRNRRTRTSYYRIPSLRTRVDRTPGGDVRAAQLAWFQVPVLVSRAYSSIR